MLAGPPRRVVSLVPSLTEAVAATTAELLVGVTDYCTHPADLAVPRVGGTKYPDLGRVLAAVPDLVLANAEENRREDVAALRAAGVPVWVTFPRTLDDALVSLARMLDRLGVTEPPWLAAARTAWAGLPAASGSSGCASPGVRRAVVPVWRRPWVVLGSATFAGDLLTRLGVRNCYADAAERYPRPPLAELAARRPDLVVLPDEPYLFTAEDGPEAFPGIPCALVSGRHLTWYGPSLAEAPALLAAQLATTVIAPSGG
ncbi:helical backbone metal receptor [Plantactinospora sp. GCM10030261]|uniref:helical backbone metal receptor n=1 Tax=Plantactinospora sp. GCM10030261 TaxID=3273420 RepID=UPI00360A3E0E